uniref:PH domain-containing protein n=1 Tax=Noctiluca scintillans TaxID=2966 RepID=A0A7S1EXZ8_NOCSC|mmetsp:Transcript_18536/g.49746  ORF Transcript_18536/g.49746 Transcript_18536/m.49746 type:complete len:469 (+) Transcript_18536:58-1464(+)
MYFGGNPDDSFVEEPFTGTLLPSRFSCSSQGSHALIATAARGRQSDKGHVEAYALGVYMDASGTRQRTSKLGVQDFCSMLKASESGATLCLTFVKDINGKLLAQDLKESLERIASLHATVVDELLVHVPRVVRRGTVACLTLRPRFGEVEMSFCRSESICVVMPELCCGLIEIFFGDHRIVRGLLTSLLAMSGRGSTEERSKPAQEHPQQSSGVLCLAGGTEAVSWVKPSSAPVRNGLSFTLQCLEGFLYMRRPSARGSHSRWSSRYFELDSGVLRYRRAKNGAVHGRTELESARVVAEAPKLSPSGTFFVFRVMVGSSTIYHLASSDQHTAVEWTLTLSAACAFFNDVQLLDEQDSLRFQRCSTSMLEVEDSTSTRDPRKKREVLSRPSHSVRLVAPVLTTVVLAVLLAAFRGYARFCRSRTVSRSSTSLVALAGCPKTQALARLCRLAFASCGTLLSTIFTFVYLD